ncbi:Gfo/Idh/MocA family protein [Phenylobacterium immobile]|uniref:Gfo/Idh/MocA family protein n=1 Tax=Phenylobacterium immobile TaxID=21 RepID=UPI000ADA4E3A|nr:Gfo/Idh/MocA family oxidoreductase [Phenylobacterium immobile]
MSQPLRGGVIGAGVFGGYHAKQYARLDGVSLAAVLDLDAARAAAIAEPLGGRGYNDLQAFLDAVDVVTVATPATVHAGQTLAALQANRSVYVEKPIATRMDDAVALRDEALSRGLTIGCGHQERVVFRAMGLFDIPEQPLRLEAVRHGPPSERCQDVTAVLDLMIHDIDLALSLSTARPLETRATGERGPNTFDAIRADIVFDDGFACVFDASRLAPARKRTMKVVYPSGAVEIDFVARTFRNTTPFVLNEAFADTPAGKDPLGANVAAFLMAARGLAPAPIVTADEAIAALQASLAVEACL